MVGSVLGDGLRGEGEGGEGFMSKKDLVLIIPVWNRPILNFGGGGEQI